MLHVGCSVVSRSSTQELKSSAIPSDFKKLDKKSMPWHAEIKYYQWLINDG
jgi:hypothetical protein